MRSALPLALFATTGCDLVFGLGDRIEPDAAPEIDGPPEIDAAIPCDRSTSTVVAVADTTLIHDADTCDPSIRNGEYRNVNVGQASGATRSRILARFVLLPEMVDVLQSGAFESAALAMPLKPNECSGPCASAAISLSIHAANNDWNEGETTGNIGAGWCMRKQLAGPGTGMRWTVDGADGADDRSSLPLATMTMTAAQAEGDVLDVPIVPGPALADLSNWLVGTRLSILVVPSGATGTVFTKSKDDPQNGGMQLRVTTCR
jgi:hypothetical protein